MRSRRAELGPPALVGSMSLSSSGSDPFLPVATVRFADRQRLRRSMQASVSLLARGFHRRHGDATKRRRETHGDRKNYGDA
jgi:hypothetical protein